MRSVCTDRVPLCMGRAARDICTCETSRDRVRRAAPDLLLHLEQLLEHAENPLGAEEWFALRDSCRAVIQQAKGGAP